MRARKVYEERVQTALEKCALTYEECKYTLREKIAAYVRSLRAITDTKHRRRLIIWQYRTCPIVCYRKTIYYPQNVSVSSSTT